MLVIGIGGRIASGKTTTAKIIEDRLKFNVMRMSLSDVLKDLLSGNTEHYKTKIDIEWEDKEPNRENLIEFGKKLKQKYGDGILMRLALEKAISSGFGVVIIDGVRTLCEAQYILRPNVGVNIKGKLLYITAPSKVRYERLKKRSALKDENITSYNKFREVDNEEEQLYGISLLRKVSHYTINNNGSLRHLEVEVENFIEDVIRREISGEPPEE